MFLSTLATTLLLMLDEIALMVDRLRTPAAASDGPASALRIGNIALAPGRKADGNREMYLVWTVAKRSARSKAILVPAALLISGLAPYAVLPLLFVGGTYLCYEGAKTVAPGALRLWDRERRNTERFATGSPVETPKSANREDASPETVRPKTASQSFPGAEANVAERATIRAAARTDFILSAEIIVVALRPITESALLTQFGSLAAVAVFATVGVYGSVAGILKLKDGGSYLHRLNGTHAIARCGRRIGAGIVALAPRLVRTLSILGTAAAFLIGGELVALGMPGAEAALDYAAGHLAGISVIGGPFGWAIGPFLETALGLVWGAIVLGAVTAAKILLPGEANIRSAPKAEPQ